MNQTPFSVMAEALERASEPPQSDQAFSEYIRNDAFRTMARALWEMSGPSERGDGK